MQVFFQVVRRIPVLGEDQHLVLLEKGQQGTDFEVPGGNIEGAHQPHPDDINAITKQWDVKRRYWSQKEGVAAGRKGGRRGSGLKQAPPGIPVLQSVRQPRVRRPEFAVMIIGRFSNA
ncbi:MAG: hypothetical protein ACP5J4_15595 [Anaerolineae bacterium]